MVSGQLEFECRESDSSTGALTYRCYFCFGREEAHSQAGADLAASGNLEACCAFEMLFIPVEETRLCGFLGGQVKNSWQKKGANKRRVASR